MPTQLQQSVGAGGANVPADVKLVQGLLNPHSAALQIAALAVNGQADAPTLAAIQQFQTLVLHMPSADGRIDPGGRTWRELSGADTLSGGAWWQANQARFPNSESVDTLDAAFKAKVEPFLAALKAAGASVNIASTLRHPIRAYLMHYSWKVAKGILTPDKVPAQPRCDIVWDHGDLAQSRAAAQEMVNLIAIRVQPSLTSQHIQGRAIDMAVRWGGTLQVKNAQGQTVALPQPADEMNTTLHKIGLSYQVIKRVEDPPHWSVDGT